MPEPMEVSQRGMEALVGQAGRNGLWHLHGRHGVVLTPTRASWSCMMSIRATSANAPQPLASSQAAVAANADSGHLVHAAEGSRRV
ncbi:hypothetical protein BDA96_03G235100 [Sorghum bicolor]|uniref:Uncharacterized protein n=1 Tax=Sorghum bicolor TaxID=4558 RepID=A0A921RGB4_SORBI|nr:hypothetical protein BDA96_03G235100 [Sorghum bicolor]